MGVERSIAARKVKDFYEFQRETTAIIKPKKNRRRPKKMTPVQRLFEICKDVFASGESGIVPPPNDIERLRSVLDSMKPADVGLSPDSPYFEATGEQQTPPITYLHLYECSKFSMGIFCLPPFGVIPLHNHPGMTVFSKLLFGTMHIKSYDWVADAARPDFSTSLNPSRMPRDSVRLSKIMVDSDFTAPCKASILYPANGGNMHCFTAVTACAVLDVLGPPYSDPDGRPCTYYRDFPFTEFAGEGVLMADEEEEREKYAWLQEREKVEDVAVVGATYRGPKIMRN